MDKEALRREAARQTRKLEYDLKLDEIKDNTAFKSEKLQCALGEIAKIFSNQNLRTHERRARILDLMESYEVDECLLPVGVQELIAENQHDDDDV